MLKQPKYINFILVILLINLIPCHTSYADTLYPASGRDISIADILPADVLARVNMIAEELDLIRLELGKPHIVPIDISIINTAPREVYFVAQALYNKSNRLAFELTQTSVDAQVSDTASNIYPFHVWQVVNQSLDRIQTIKESLNITEKITEKIAAKSSQPKDVMSAILLTNRMLSTLLSKNVSPADVYQQITSSINISAQLLATFKSSTRIPPPPPFERRKTPIDVYQRLLFCFTQIREIAELSKISILDFKLANMRSANAPSDVYDLATLVVSELSYFHSRRKQASPAAKAYFPGFKTPSHVFQRVSMLEAQLTDLLQKVQKNPAWLSAK